MPRPPPRAACASAPLHAASAAEPSRGSIWTTAGYLYQHSTGLLVEAPDLWLVPGLCTPLLYAPGRSRCSAAFGEEDEADDTEARVAIGDGCLCRADPLPDSCSLPVPSPSPSPSPSFSFSLSLSLSLALVRPWPCLAPWLCGSPAGTATTEASARRLHRQRRRERLRQLTRCR